MLVARLLEDRREVLNLLAENPFPKEPPARIRARLYTYPFTDPVERRRTGRWWNRTLEGEHLPPLSAGDELAREVLGPGYQLPAASPMRYIGPRGRRGDHRRRESVARRSGDTRPVDGRFRWRSLAGGGILGILFLVPLITAAPLRAQGTRVSVGYEVRNYRYSAELAPEAGDGAGMLTSGVLQAEYLRLFAGPLHASATASYLVHDDGAFFLGGPVRFDGWDVGLNLGLQGSRLGIFGSIRGGRLGSIRARATAPDGGRAWVPPSGSDGEWTASVGGGIRYYLLPVVEAKAQLMTSLGDPARIEMDPGGSPASVFRTAELDPVTGSLSLSLSIPFGGGSSRAGNARDLRPAAGGAADRGLAAPGGAGPFMAPLEGSSVITSPFGGRRGHTGVDLEAEEGEPVHAAAAGTVVRAETAGGYGTMVELMHDDGFATVYGHLAEIRVGPGQQVAAGEVIGTAGSTGRSSGSHLHFEVRRHGRPVDPTGLVRYH